MPQPPNVLVIMTDEHAPQASGVYGSTLVQTPRLDRLAAEGVVMDRAYCNSPLCVPSRMSFVTGRYVHRIGAWDNGAVLPSDAVTWAHRFAAAGYETALIGKMHFQGLDQGHGFDRHPPGEIHGAGPLGQARAWRPEDPSAVRVPPVPEDTPPMRRRILGAGAGRSVGQAYDEAVRDETVRFLRERGADAGKRPFALCCSFISPHFPLVAPEADFALYWPHGADLPALPPGRHPHHGRLVRHFQLEGFSDLEIRRARAAYFGLVTFTDRLVGDVLDALSGAGLAEDTLVVYTADHGETMGEHGLWWKCNFYEQSVRVPLIFRWPGRLPAGVRRGRVCSLVDVVATMCDLGGVAVAGPDAPDGDSLAGVLRGDSAARAAWKDEAFSEYHAHASVHAMGMLRTPRFKLNYAVDEPTELYDLEADPGETRDLAGEPAYGAVVAQLTRRLLAQWPAEAVQERRRRDAARRRTLMAARS